MNGFSVNRQQVVSGLEYNPRLFLYLLIIAVVLVFSYEFATQLSDRWFTAVLFSGGLLAISCILAWPFQSVMAYLGCSIWFPSFMRGQTVAGIGGALVYAGDLFIVAFVILEFFRGCMRQTHLYTSFDRWVLALFGWMLFCIGRGALGWGYSAVGEGRDFLHIIAYFAVIHYVIRAEETTRVLKWLAWMTGLGSFFALCWFIYSGFQPRVVGGNLGLGAALNVMTLGVLLGRDQLKRFRFLATLVIVFQVFLALYSLARGIILALLITLPFLLWIGRRHFIKAMAVIAGSVVCLLIMVSVMDPMLDHKLTEFAEKQYQGIINPSDDITGAWRIYSYKWEMEKIFSNPVWTLCGQGFGGYYYWYFSLTDEPVRTAPHNLLVVIWSKSGFIGLTLFLIVLLLWYRNCFRFLTRSRNEIHRSVMMIIMLMVLGDLAYQMTIGNVILSMWYLIALGTALQRLWLPETTAPAIIHSGFRMRAARHSRPSPVGRPITS